jgi:hypothetical protein
MDSDEITALERSLADGDDPPGVGLGELTRRAGAVPDWNGSQDLSAV